MPKKSNKGKRQKQKQRRVVNEKQKQKQSSVIHINIGDKQNTGSGSGKEQVRYANPIAPTLLMNTQPSSISGVGELAKLLSVMQNSSSINQLGMGRVNPRYAYDSLTEQRLAEQQRIINDNFGLNRVGQNESDMRSFFQKLDENQMKQTQTGFEPRFMDELQSDISTTTNVRSDEVEFEEQEQEVAEEKAMEEKEEDENEEVPLKTIKIKLTDDVIYKNFTFDPNSVSFENLKSLGVKTQRLILNDIKRNLAKDDLPMQKGYIDAYRAFTGEKANYRIGKYSLLKKINNLNL